MSATRPPNRRRASQYSSGSAARLTSAEVVRSPLTLSPKMRSPTACTRKDGSGWSYHPRPMSVL